MTAPIRDANDPDPPSDVTLSDEGSIARPRGDHTEIILDASDDDAAAGPDTLTPGQETPPDPMPATVEFRPKAVESADDPSAASQANAPFLTLGDPTITINPPRAAAPLPSASVRHSVPGYEIERELGRGGMGVVYQARQKDLNRPVALKMILSGDHAGVGERERFRREAESVAALQHPNIVQIFEIGEVDGRPYLAFEYIEGGTLAHHLAGTPWPPRAAAGLVEVLARTMQFAHDRGIVHRDLKPGNILISGFEPRHSELHEVELFRSSPAELRSPKSGWKSDKVAQSAIPKITDFGLAKKVEPESDWSETGVGAVGEPDDLAAPAGAGAAAPQTRTGAVMGTPSYIAPEQAAGKNRDVGPAADVYALGAILYELLTGRPPFRGETPLDTVLQVMSEDPVPVRQLAPKVPRDLETICLKCLQKQPSKRYVTAGELADDLHRFLNHEPIAARPTGAWERFAKWAKRHPAAATSLLTSFFALIITLGISFYFNFELRKSAEQKEDEAKNAIAARKAAEEAALEKDKQTRIANGEREKARARLKEAEEARVKFEHAHKEALKREEEARRSAYALALNRASTLAERDPQRAARLLDSKQNCPTELRDFTWHHLRALCRVEQGVLAGHLRPVLRVAWSPDGALLASASWDGTIRVWNVRAHQAIAVLRGHRGYVQSVLFAADGRTLVSAGNDHQVRFWEIPQALSLRGADGPPWPLNSWAVVDAGDVQAIAVSPDSRRVAAGGADGKIRLWTIPSLPRFGLMAIGGGPLSFAARLPEGEPTPEHGPALPVSVQPAAEETLAGHPSGIKALVWNGEGLWSGGDDKTIRLWTLGSKSAGELVYMHSSPILAFDVSPASGLLAVSGISSDDASVYLWNYRQRVQAARFRAHTRAVNSLCFGADGKLLATASHDGTMRLWDVLSGQERTVFRGHKEPVRCVAFSPDRRTLASGGQDNTVRFWSLTPHRDDPIPINAHAPLLGAAVDSASRVLAIADADGGIKVWRRGPADLDISARCSYELRGLQGRVTALAVSPTGDCIAAVAEQGNQWLVGIWNLPPPAAKGSLEIKLARSWKSPAHVYGLALYGDRLATAGEGGLQIWNLKSRDLLYQPSTLRNKPRSVAFTPDGKHLVSAGGRFIQVWDMATGRDRCTLYTGLGNQDITMVAVGATLRDRDGPQDHPGWTVVTADVGGAARIWDLEPTPAVQGKPLLEYQSLHLAERAVMTGHAEPVTGISFSPDGKTIATTSEDRTIRLWDPQIGQERAALSGHADTALMATFLPDESALLSVGREGALKVWHAPR